LITAIVAGLVVSFQIAPDAHGAATVTWGNEPMPAPNYTDWPNIMPVINHRSRVYAWWVNGNEMFYFRGDNDALNAALRDFAKVGTDQRIVVLRPGPDAAGTLDQKETVPYDWNLHLMGGIAKAMVGRHGGPTPWDAWPTVTIRIGGNVALEKIEMAKGVKVMHAGDMAAVLRERLKSENAQVRGYAALELPDIAPYNADDARAVAALLETDDDWQLQMAASSLSRYGHLAKFALPKLREGLKHEKEHVRKRFTEVIETIENAKHDAEAEKAHRESVQRIDTFVNGLKGDAP
jgi:hypothetical protein